MKNRVFILLVFTVLFVACNNSSKNVVEITSHVYGNCEKCKRTIDSAAKIKGVSEANWNVDSKLLTFKIDTVITTSTLVLKSIAASGYDNEAFTGNDYAYQKLPACCQYERKDE